jgi:hypothetical protein
MADPIVFISHHRIKPGKAEPMRALLAQMWSAMETEKPQTLMNLAYVSDDGTEITFMHAFADVEGMQLHWQGVDDRTSRLTSTWNRSGSRSTDRRASRS